MKPLSRASVTLLCLLFIASAVHAGPVLDRILNQMVLDTSNSPLHQSRSKTIRPDNPIGQSFTTGANVAEISRIAISCSSWHKTWTEDESLVLTLYDSPEKTVQIASAELPYKWRAWEGAVQMLTLNTKAKPNTLHYFEMTMKGGDGVFQGMFWGNKYEGGEAYEAGKPVERSIWFEVHTRPVFDRDAAYAERFTHWNLNYPGMEKVKAAVDKNDWDAAVDELIRYYESNPNLLDKGNATPKPDPRYDTTYDDLAVDMKLKDANGNIVDLGPCWNHFRTWSTIGGVGLTRSGLLKNFANGYRNTGNEKYAKALNDMMICRLNDEPCPLRSGVIPPGADDVIATAEDGIAGGSMWSGLSIAARVGQMWHWYSCFVNSPSFTRDVRAGMIFNMVDMAETLSIQRYGGNWETQMFSSLFSFAESHPELAKSKQWFDNGLADLLKNLWDTVRPDGPIGEATSGYNWLVVNRFLGTLETCRNLGIPIEPRYVKRVEKALEYLMYATQPDWNLPSRGDTFNYVSPANLLKRGADHYGRDDFRWLGSKGVKGRPPLATSCRFPIVGWYVMRSDWTPDARYLNLHNGINTAHGHADELSITISAYGENLVVDPGAYIYGTPEHSALYESKKHATLTVDDANTITEKGDSKWASLSFADVYAGTNAGYENARGARHTRKIVFLKPDYWVMSDTAGGPSGEHEVAVRFPFAPGKLTLDAVTGACRSGNSGGNLMIVPCPDSGFAGELYDYQFPTPSSGLQNAPGVTYHKKAPLPVELVTALIPYKGRTAPKCAMRRIAENTYEITREQGIDIVCFGPARNDKIEFVGDACALRLVDGRVGSAAWLNGSLLSLGGASVARSAAPIESLELVYDGAHLTVTAARPESSLEVAALGARSVRVGCAPNRQVTGPTVSPYR